MKAKKSLRTGLVAGSALALAALVTGPAWGQITVPSMSTIIVDDEEGQDYVVLGTLYVNDSEDITVKLQGGTVFWNDSTGTVLPTSVGTCDVDDDSVVDDQSGLGLC